MLKGFAAIGLGTIIAMAPLAKFTSVTAFAQTDQSTASTASLVGSYKLVANTRKIVDTGETSDAYGKQPTGYINYAPDGRMLVVIVYDKNDRPPPDKLAMPSDE